MVLKRALHVLMNSVTKNMNPLLFGFIVCLVAVFSGNALESDEKGDFLNFLGKFTSSNFFVLGPEPTRLGQNLMA